MSHVVHIQTEVRDPLAVSAACERLRLPPPMQGEHQLFGNRIVGLGVQLPRWQYPVVCQTETGKLQYDNFEGRWGAVEELYRFLQGYAVEKTKLEARKQGHDVVERTLDDGSVRLTVQVGG